jgi:hypothetical protein
MPDTPPPDFERRMAAMEQLIHEALKSKPAGRSGNGPSGGGGPTAADGSASGEDELIAVPASGISPKPIHWLVPDFVPLNGITLIGGDGGYGKSALSLDLASAVSRGVAWGGLTYKPPAPADVMLIGCEDSWEHTVVPRLYAAGADVRRVITIQGVKTSEGNKSHWYLDRIDLIARHLDRQPEIKVVIIDPAQAFLPPGVDDHKDAEVRLALAPLTTLADERSIAVVLIRHLNKNENATAGNRFGGSRGWVNLARAAFLVLPDPDDEANERRLFLIVKRNLTKRSGGLAFKAQQWPEMNDLPFDASHLSEKDREALAGQLFTIDWQGEVSISPDDAMKSLRQGSKDDEGEDDRCSEWLEEFLSVYAYPSSEVFDAGKQKGYSKKRIYKAKDVLEIKPAKMGWAGGWVWGKGPKDSWVKRPELSHESPSRQVGKVRQVRGSSGEVREGLTDEPAIELAHEVGELGELLQLSESGECGKVRDEDDWGEIP